MKRPTKQRALIAAGSALCAALGLVTTGVTFGQFSSTETQQANQLSGSTFSPSTAPQPTATNQTPGSNTVSITWSTSVSLSDTSGEGTIEFSVVRSDGVTVCSLVTTSPCTDSTGTGGTKYTYTETAYYVVNGTKTWSLGPSAPSNQIVFPETPAFTTSLTEPSSEPVGTTWNDVATVGGDPNGGPPTGSVTFSFCQEATTGTPCINSSGYQGTPVTFPAVNSSSGPPGYTTSGNSGIFTAPGGDAETPTVGTYCYNASYTAPTAGAYSSVSVQTDTECFTVTPATPSFGTSLNNPMCTTLGNSCSDSATVTGNSTAGYPTGTVAWTLCQEASVGTPCTNTTNDQGSVTSAGSVTISSGSGTSATYTPSSTETPQNAGTYCFNASYTSTNSNYNNVPQESGSECFAVAPATPSNVVTNSTPAQLGQSLTFTATVTGPAGVTQPTGGTVTWTVTVDGSPGSCNSSPSTTTLNGSSQSTCTISPLTAGPYVVSDSWGGNGNYNSAASATDTVDPDGTGSMIVSSPAVTPSSSGSFTFTYTAGTDGVTNGAVDLAFPSSWVTDGGSAPQTTSSSTAGYTTLSGCSGCSLSISGTSPNFVIAVTGVTLAGDGSPGSFGIVFGGAGSGAVTTPSTAGSPYSFTASEKSTSSGTLTNLAASPSVTVATFGASDLGHTTTATGASCTTSGSVVTCSVTVSAPTSGRTELVFADVSGANSSISSAVPGGSVTSPTLLDTEGSTGTELDYVWTASAGSGTSVTVAFTYSGSVGAMEVALDVVQLNAGNSVRSGSAKGGSGKASSFPVSLGGSPSSFDGAVAFAGSDNNISFSDASLTALSGGKDNHYGWNSFTASNAQNLASTVDISSSNKDYAWTALEIVP